MKYTCPHCGKRYDIGEDFLKSGTTKMKCRQCKNVMVIDPAGREDAPRPEKSRTGPGFVTAPRDGLPSLAPGAQEDGEDLPVTARSAEEDLVREFDLEPPTLPPGVVKPARADLPTPRNAGEGKEDFEITGEFSPAPTEDLPVIKVGVGNESFDLDMPFPSPAPAPSARPRKPEEFKQRVQQSADVTFKNTVAGLPSAAPAARPVARGTVAGMPPAAPRHPAARPAKPAAVVDLPAPRPAVGDLEDPFGALDLPSVPAREKQAARSEFDMPRAAPEPGPPAPRASAAGASGDFDLPAAPPRREPTVKGIPAREKMGTPLPPVLDTPSVPVASPMARGREIGELPGVPAHAMDEPFGALEIDLPGMPARDDPFSVLDGPARPAAAPAGPPPDAPLPGLRDLPTKRGAAPAADPFAALDLPPAAGGPAPAPAGSRDIFAEIDDEVGKPSVTTRPAKIVRPEDQAQAQAVGEAGGVSFGEISLADEPGQEMAGEEAADLPERKRRAAESEEAGGALEIDSLAASGQLQRVSAAPRISKIRPAEEKPRRSARPALIVLLVLVVAGAGAALYATGLYLDIYKYAWKIVGRDLDALVAERTELIGSVSASLSEDRYTDYAAALDRLSKRLRSRKDEEIGAYAVHLAYVTQIRFGAIAEYDALAEKELRRLSFGKNLSREQILALSAKQIFQGKDVGTAVQRLEDLRRGKGSGDPDVLSLLGLAGLRTGDGARALAAYQALEQIEKDSARARFGRVRALLALGKDEEAGTILDDLLEDKPEHLDSKVLRARMLLGQGSLDQAAIVLEGILAVGGDVLGKSQSSTVRALLGRIHLEKQETTWSLELFTEAEKLDPDNVDALIGLAQIHLMKQEPGKALSRFKMAAVVDPTNIEATLGIVECQIDLAEFTEANKTLIDLKNRYPDDYRVHQLIGRYTQAIQDYEQAEIAFTKAIELNPSVLASYLDLASLFFEEQRFSEALEILGQAKEKLPPTASLYAAFAKGYLERGDIEAALAEIKNALDVDPDHAQAHFLLGVARFRLKEYAASEEALQWVAEREPSFPGLVLQQGLLFEAIGQIDKAEKYYAEALAAQPDDPEIMTRTAAVLVASGQYIKAREILDKVLLGDPNDPEALYFLGRVELGEGKPVQALELMKKAIRLQPGIAVYHLYEAFAHESAGSYSDALGSAARSIELDQSLAEAYLLRGRLLVRMGTVKDGMKDLLKALDLKPSLVEAYAPLGKAAESLRKWNDAIGYYRKAVESFPDDGEALSNLALLLYDHGGRQEAVSHLEKAVELGRAAEGQPKWFYTALYYLGLTYETAGTEDAAIGIYEEYLEKAPLQAIDRADVEKRLEKLQE